jgi:hypothetical protein
MQFGSSNSIVPGNVATLPHTRSAGQYFVGTIEYRIDLSYQNTSSPWTQNSSCLLTLREAAGTGQTQGQTWVQQISQAVGGGIGYQVDRGGDPWTNGPNEWWDWGLGTGTLGRVSLKMEIRDENTKMYYDLHDGNGWITQATVDHTGTTETMMTLVSVSFTAGGLSEEDPTAWVYADSIKVEVIPEPATLATLVIGALAMTLLKRRKG